MQLSVWWMFVIAIFSKLAHYINGVTCKALNEVKDGLNVTLQCESNVEELTFIFFNYTDFTSTQIGECKFRKLQHCMLYEKTYLAWFDIKQTSSSGELTLVNLTRNHYGRYTCLDTYSPNNNDTIEVNGSATVRESKSSNTRVVVIVCACGGALLLCVLFACCLRKKSAACCTYVTAGESVSNSSYSQTIEQNHSAIQNGSHEPSRITQLDIEMTDLNQTTEPLLEQCSGDTKSVASLAEIYGGQSNQYRCVSSIEQRTRRQMHPV